MKKDKNVIQNAVSILKALSEFQTTTQIELEKTIQLRRTSIFNIFKLLKEYGFVYQADTIIPPKGRPSIVWRLNGNTGVFMVVYSNISYNYYALYDFSGKLISISKGRPSASLDEFVKDLKRHIENIEDGKLCGVMVALSGALDLQEDKITLSAFWKVKDYPFKEKLVSQLNLKHKPFITIENNAHLAAWGEKTDGKCKSTSNFITLYIAEGNRDKKDIELGLGSGMVFNNRLFSGDYGFAGELDGSFYSWLAKHCASGLPFCLRDINEKDIKLFAADLGEKFSHVVNYLTPEKVIVLSEGEKPPETFMDSFRESIKKRLITSRFADFSVELSSLGVSAVLHGGANILRRKYFSLSPHVTDMVKKRLQNNI